MFRKERKKQRKKERKRERETEAHARYAAKVKKVNFRFHGVPRKASAREPEVVTIGFLVGERGEPRRWIHRLPSITANDHQQKPIHPPIYRRGSLESFMQPPSLQRRRRRRSFRTSSIKDSIVLSSARDSKLNLQFSRLDRT